MKKILALAMALVLLATALIGCTTLEKDAEGNYDRGAVVKMYLTTEVFNFDPQIAINDDAMLQIFSLLYEGLTKLDSDGDWEKAIMDDYEVNEDDRDGYSILIDLKDTKWTDGRTVQANDFVFAWKRLVNPNSRSEAASLLFDIKNARKINQGIVSIDDMGVSAVDTYTLKVTFENENVDLDRFFTNTSSIALVPLREDVITRFMYPDVIPEITTVETTEPVTDANGNVITEETTIGEPAEYDPVEYGDYWARRAGAIVTNGPFTVKVNDEAGELRLERSSYYYRDTEKNEYLDKYVIPYRLVTDYSNGDAKAQLELYNNEGIFYVGNLPLDERKNYEDDAEVSDMMVTHSYFFNTENPIFADAKVRRALSLALDREHIADLLTFAAPAVGVIPEGAFDTDYKSDFREEGEDLIAPTADEAAAKELLRGVKLDSKSFSITVRNNEADIAVAEYAKSQWEKLGFDVEINKVTKNEVVERTDTSTDTPFEYVMDAFQELYDTRDFDVIAVDMNMYSPDPFNALAQFAGDFSGNGADMLSENIDINLHVTGYNNDKYIELIEKAYEATDEDERAALLHEAEKLLVDDMPVCPVVTLQSAYIANDILSGIKTTYYGTTDFKRMKMKDYMDYKEEETEMAQTPSDEE